MSTKRGTHTVTHGPATAFRYAAGKAKAKAFIHGTWDFKWPQGYEFRIAFQRIAGDRGDQQLNQAIAAFQATVEPWTQANANIGWRYLPDFMPAPRAACVAESYLPLPPKPGTPEAQAQPLHHEIQYDVLVSFTALPVSLPRIERDPTPHHVYVQSSELGCFSQRVDYGVPTLFVGPSVPGTALVDWIAQDEFKAAVVHEFGHTLGLPHTHQNPLYDRPPLKSDAEILDVLKQINRYSEFPADQIDDELSQPWPFVEPILPPNGGGHRHRVPYSDWLPMPAELAAGKPLEQLSCLTHPGWSLLLAGAPAPSGPVEELTAPTAYDLSWLSHTYPKGS